MEKGKLSKATGYVSAVCSVLAADASFSCVQAMRGAVPDFQLSVARAVVQLSLYMIGGIIIGAEWSIGKGDIPGLLYLAGAYMAVNIGYYGSATYLPLTEVSGIGTISMIVTAFLQSRLLFNKDITKSNIISCLVCVVGIILAVQPSWLFSHMKHECNLTTLSFENVSENISSCSEEYISKSATLMGYGLAIIGGVGAGLTYDVSGIILQGVKPIVQAVYGAAFSSIGSMVFMFYLEEPVLKTNIYQFMLVLGHGVFSALASFLHLQSASSIRGPSLSVLYSFEVVTLLVWQYTIMHSVLPGNYNWIEVVGCFIIVFGSSIPAVVDILAHRAKADELP